MFHVEHSENLVLWKFVRTGQPTGTARPTGRIKICAPRWLKRIVLMGLSLAAQLWKRFRIGSPVAREPRFVVCE